jgi:glucose/arabinose dehydrogenase
VRHPVFSLLLSAVTLAASPRTPPACAPDNGGLDLPVGFCATVFANQLGPVRHLAALPNGDLVAAVGGAQGGVLVLRDTNGDGRADLIRQSGPAGGNGLLWRDGYLYFATATEVMRWPWRPGQVEPAGTAETIVEGLPNDGNHTTKSLAIGADGALYVSIGSATNSCQKEDRSRGSPGINPCAELATRAGVWRFAANEQHQHQSDGTRWATGLRNAVALAAQPGSGRLFVAVHGRDQLAANWGFSDSVSAEVPAEEFAEIKQGTDLGWPYCYFDPLQGKKVSAPEYGGDGKSVGSCGDKQAPLIGFPGHWGPMAIAFYDRELFPHAYRGGAFLAFHGSWNRAPLPQAGYRIVFVPFADGQVSGQYQTFATATGNPTGLRPSGVAVAPDGALFIGSDGNHKIWRVIPKSN